VGIAALLGLAAGGTVPVVVSTGTTLLPASLLAVLGLAGAAASLGPVLNADPNSALGAAR
jgi:putative ABC transport system permease protein